MTNFKPFQIGQYKNADDLIEQLTEQILEWENFENVIVLIWENTSENLEAWKRLYFNSKKWIETKSYF